MPESSDILTRPAPPATLQVRYGPLPDHVADAPLPDGDAAPLVVVVHGGFWRAAYDRRHTGPQCHALSRAGYVVASVEYRRTGAGGGWPETFDDVATALDTVPGLVARAAPGRVMTSRVVHVGHSAGGHLVTWAASRHRLPGHSRWHRSEPDRGLRGVVSLAGVLDLHVAARDRLGDGAVVRLLGGGTDDVPDRYALADPIGLAPAGVDMTLVHGSDDDTVPVRLSRTYAARSGADLVELTATGHFDVIDPESTAWPAVVSAISALHRT